MSNCNFNLNLPIDIPWKRKCVSKDMIDTRLCDNVTPYRWRSSIVVFEYEPEEEFQNYEGMIISYLKVSCTITGYQENPEEIGLDYKGIRSFWKDQEGIENYLEVLQKYYPCYGAILEVGVAPEDKQISQDKFPYFLDFEPKKRELYELVTSTGETSSRSLQNISIGKSNTSLQSNEVVDIDKGWSFGITGGSENYKGGLSAGNNMESGTRDITQNQSTNVKNTDTSQEMRETESHTTLLSQLYHQLDSYHIGTNRAVFFIHPRPHTIENVHTFVNGPRNIEGIQDFLLVVARPKEVKSICVEAYLETGHIGKIPIPPSTEEVTGSERVVFFNGEFKAEYKVDSETTIYDRSDKIWDINDHHPGFEIKSASITPGSPIFINEDDGPDSVWDLVDETPYISYQDRNLVKVSGQVHSFYENITIAADNRASISFPFQVKITIRQTTQVENDVDVLFITGRKLCCCPKDISKFKPGIVFEKDTPWSNRVLESQQKKSSKMPISLANQISVEIKDMLIRSRTDTANRYSKESINLPQSTLAFKTLVKLLGDNINIKISEHSEISKTLKSKLLDFNKNLKVKDVMKMPIEMQQDLFHLNIKEVKELRNNLIGINYKYDPKNAWLKSKQLEWLAKYKNK